MMMLVNILNMAITKDSHQLKNNQPYSTLRTSFAFNTFCTCEELYIYIYLGWRIWEFNSIWLSLQSKTQHKCKIQPFPPWHHVITVLWDDCHNVFSKIQNGLYVYNKKKNDVWNDILQNEIYKVYLDNHWILDVKFVNTLFQQFCKQINVSFFYTAWIIFDQLYLFVIY